MAALNALGSVSQGLSKQNATSTGTVRAIAKSNPKPYLGREASYSGSAAVAPQTQEARGNVGRQGTRAGLQYATAFNAANGPREETAKMSNLDKLASIYNALVQDYRETPILTDSLRNATKQLWDAYATTPLSANAPRETQIFQEMTRMNATKPSQESIDAQKAYFGHDLFGQDRDYARYSPLNPYFSGDKMYYGDFQRQYVQRLLNEGLIPTSAGDKLAADVESWTDFTQSDAPRTEQNIDKTLNPAIPQEGRDVWLQFQGNKIGVRPEDVYYNPKYHAVGIGNIFYDVFGGRVANSAWGNESDDGYADLMFPDAPYETQGYAGHWAGDKRTLTNPRSEGYKIKTMTVQDDVPIAPNRGERQVLNRETTTKPLISEADVPGVSLGTLQPWRQAGQMNPTYGAIDPRSSSGGYVYEYGPDSQGYFGEKRPQMMDVRQNYNAKGFDGISWEPYAYAAHSLYNNQMYGVQRYGAENPQSGFSMGPLTYLYPSASDRSVQPGFKLTHPSAPGATFDFAASEVNPQFLNRDERLALGYGE